MESKKDSAFQGKGDKELREERSPSVMDVDGVESAEEAKPKESKGRKRGKSRGAGTSRPQKSKPTSLSLLPEMPLDILFEIFEYLDIRDVINLSRTTRAFRNTLLDPSASSVWRSLRQALDAPEPLGNMSEARWAELLFGTACQNCGANNRRELYRANFFIRRRLCKACQKRSLIAEPDLKKVFDIPEYVPIRDFVPSVRVDKEDQNRYFYRPEVKIIVKKLKELHRDRQGENAAEAIERYRAFQEERSQLVLSVLKRAHKCSKWLKQYVNYLQSSKERVIAQRRADIFERLRALGYADEDIERQSNSPEVNQPRLLSERVWQKILPILEKNIWDDIEKRQEEAISGVYESRKKLVETFYSEYRRISRPSALLYMPRTEELFHLNPIRALMEAPLDLQFTVQHVAQIMTNLTTILDHLSEAKCWKYLRLLQEQQPKVLITEPGDIPFEAVAMVLNLATSVFICHQTRNTHKNPFVMIGQDELLSHHCDPEITSDDAKLKKFAYNPSTRTVSYSLEGAEVAKTLLQMAGLNPAVARVSEMDGLNLRFKCNKETSDWKQYSPDIGFFVVQIVYEWRGAITHALTCRHGCEWEMLSQADTQGVLERERNDAKWSKSKWACNHCPGSAPDHLQRREEVIQDIRATHQINDPQEGRDYIFFERFRAPIQSTIWHTVEANTLDEEWP